MRDKLSARSQIEEVDKILTIYKENIEKYKNESRLYVISETELEYLEQIYQENQKLKETLNDKCLSINALQAALKERANERDNHSHKEYLYRNAIDETRKYIEDKIQKSFDYDFGLGNSSYKDRLFTETVVELQLIDQMLARANIK